MGKQTVLNGYKDDMLIVLFNTLPYRCIRNIGKNHKFQSMITELNLMRSHILLYLILAILAVVLGRYWLAFIYVSLIFVFGGKKHNTKINKIRKGYYERSVKEEP